MAPKYSFSVATLFTLITISQSETINRFATDYTPVQCTSFPCIVNCVAVSSCRQTNISCPTEGSGECIINLIGNNAAYASTIYTRLSSTTNITVYGNTAAQYSTIYAHKQIGARLKIQVEGGSGLRNSKIFSPYGEGSQLTIVGGKTGTSANSQIRDCEIFDDYSTKVVMEAFRPYAFDNTVVENIFRNNPYFSITKPGSIDPNYRASVRLYSDEYSFRFFEYYGTDHGDWDIRSDSSSGSYVDFQDATVYADHSFITNDSYTISLIGGAWEAMHLNLYASQNNVNIIIQALASRAFWDGNSRYLKVNCLPTLSNGDTYAINSFTALSTSEYGFYKSSMNISTTVTGNVTFISTYRRAFLGEGTGGYYFGDVLGEVLILSNSTATTDCDRGFYKVEMQFDSIAETLQIRDPTVLGQGFYRSQLTVYGNIGGDVILESENSNGGQSFRYSEFTLGDIGGKVVLSQRGTTGYAFDDSIFNISSIGSDLLITDYAENGRMIQYSEFTAGDIGGDVIIKDLSDSNSDSSGGFTCYQSVFVFGNVGGNVDMIITGVAGRSFEKSQFTMDSIGNGPNGGGLYINDTAVNGRGFYDGIFTVNGDINGEIFIIDNTNVTGHTAYNAEITCGNVKDVTLMSNTYGGYSFRYSKFNVGDIDGSFFHATVGWRGHALEDASITAGDVSGDVIIQDQSKDTGYYGGRLCSRSNFTFGDITGKLDLISITESDNSFESANFIIGSIGEDLTAHDISDNGRGFQNAFFDVGTVSGNVLFRDDADGSGGGAGMYTSDIRIGHIGGNVDLIDSGVVGRAFYQSNFEFGFIGGNLNVEASKNTLWDQAFFMTNWKIGTIEGNATFTMYVPGAFWGYSAPTTLNISNASNIVILTLSDYAFSNVDAHFGGNPNVEINIEGGYRAIYGSTFDCRDCKKFTVRCNNADCDGHSGAGNPQIYCPKNNSLDTCKMHCSRTAGCNGIDVFTTNGYCEDFRMYCLDSLTNACNMGSLTKVYCTNSGAVEYGDTTHFCPMQKDSSAFENNFFCGTGECTNSCTEQPTHSPIPSPSMSPTPAPSNSPTIAPTAAPTPAPTDSPSQSPTPAPTSDPTKNPTTPRPTTPDQLFCGDIDTGSYSGIPLLFNVQLNYFGDLTFDAAQSSFNVTAMEAYSKLNVFLATDASDGVNDKSITLMDAIPGDYKFYIHGDKSGLYNVQITCVSDSPTATPTNNPTPAPTSQPSPAPSFSPSDYPTSTPTAPPTNTPTSPPSNIPSQSPSVSPSPAPSHSPTIDPTIDPTQDPTIDPTEFPTTDPTNDPTIEPTIDPTYNPSVTPTKMPTNEPSPSPSKAPTVDIIAAIVKHQAAQNNNSEMNITDLFLIIAAVAVVVGCFCVCCYFGFKSYRMKKRQFMKDIQGMNNFNSPTVTQSGAQSPSSFPKSPSTDNPNEGENYNTNELDLDLPQMNGNALYKEDGVKPTSLFEDVGYKIKDDEKGMMPQDGTKMTNMSTFSAVDKLTQIWSPKKQGKEDVRVQMSNLNVNGATHTIQKTGEFDEDDLDEYLDPVKDVKMMNLYIKSANHDNNNIKLKVWLDNMGFVQYLPAFKEQGFEENISALAEITDQDLKDMCVNKIAHRRVIMTQVRTLKLNMHSNHRYFAKVDKDDYKIDTFGSMNTYKPEQREDIVTVASNVIAIPPAQTMVNAEPTQSFIVESETAGNVAYETIELDNK